MTWIRICGGMEPLSGGPHL